MDDNVVAALAVVCIFGLPVAGWIVTRMLKHMERMEMIKRGITPPGDSSNREMWDHVFAARQAAPPPGPGMYVSHPSNWNQNAQNCLRKGIVTTAVGFALLIGLSFIGMRDGVFVPGPWLLGGLIPMFVGLAQIANAMLAGAQFPRSGMTIGPIPPPPPGSAPPPPASGAYTYRPGATEELPRTKPPRTQ
ncbi:MAG TPA: DUF6249 domain-containing protein [Candidatus Baltobacteraceae bacterium]